MALKQKRRHQEWVHIRRKMRVIKDIWNDTDWILYRETHRLSKGKIHCSCPMCSPKTNRKRGALNCGWKPSDRRKLAKGWEDDDIDHHFGRGTKKKKGD